MSEIEEAYTAVEHYKVCVAGYQAVGKTKLLTRYKTKTYNDSGVMTLMVDHLPVAKAINGRNYVFDYYDTAGQERYMSSVQMYFRNSHACIFVYDVSKSDTLDKLYTFFNIVNDIVPYALKIIVGSKCDLYNQCSEATLDKYKQKGIKCFLASAKTGQNVNEIFTELYNQIIGTRKPSYAPKQKPVVISNNPGQKKVDKYKCC